MLGQVLFGFFGLAVLLGIAWCFSNNKRQVDWRLVATGLALQIGFAVFVLLVPFGTTLFDGLSQVFVRLIGYTQQGAEFMFGNLARSDQMGFIFAFQVLPTIIFFAAFMAILYHLNVMQLVVRAMAWGITKVMRVSGAETTSVCANVFIGQTEAPLTVRPYIGKMTDSELLTLMIGGMATIAGGVMAGFVQMLGGDDPSRQAEFAKHFIAASIMAAPATLVIAKILVPETGDPLTRGSVRVEVEHTSVNVIDAAANGAADGVRLAINVAGMLIAFVALIALINAPIGWFGGLFGNPELTLQSILGTILAPLAWVIGVPWEEADKVGALIGQKVVLNEFVAYLALAGEVTAGTLSPQATLIATYALCGFANFSSIAIQIGGIGGLAPERRGDLARFGLRAVLGGSLATFMTATIAGVLTQLA